MNPDLADFLPRHAPLLEESATWGNLQLRITGYLGLEQPPVSCITSVRCVVFQGDAVLVVQDPHGLHVLPGGRREPGETLEETLRRELLEETGWAIQSPSLIGFAHFHHLSPKPPDYKYPHPDFLQVVYTAEAADFRSDGTRPDEWVLSASFRPIAEVQKLDLEPGYRLYLDAALRARGR